MNLTENIRLAAKQAISLVFIHALMLLLGGFAHEKIDLLYSMSAYSPILISLALMPLVAAFFLSTKFARQASVTLLGILPAEMIFHIVARFSGPPRIARIDSSWIWEITYEGSLGIVLVLEAICLWLTVKILREVHKQIFPPDALNK